jgi:tetratricopeptide (TPR) repeat protein
MKTLRNILPILILVLTVSISEAQKNKIYSAQTNIDAYLSSKNPDDLLQAKQIIDEVVKHEKTIGFWKAWYTYGKVYQLLGSDSIAKSVDPTYLLTALEAYDKSFDLADGRIDMYTKDDIIMYLKSLSVAFYNDGVDYYSAKDYETAASYFLGVITTDELLERENGEGMPFAANSTEMAVVSYRLMADQARNASDLEGYLAKIKEGQSIFPGNADLMTDEINYYLMADKIQEGMSIVQNAIAVQTEALSADPENQTISQQISMLYVVEGEAFFRNNNTEGALKSFEKAVTYNPDNHTAQYNCGVILVEQFNLSGKSLNEMSDLDDATYNSMNEDRYVAYLKPALAFLLVAQSIDTDNTEYSTMVSNIQSLLGDR